MQPIKYWPKKAYWDTIIAQMTAGGYELLSWVTINSNNFKYHVPVEVAQVTSLFFRYKSLIVELTYNHLEGYYDSPVNCHMTVKVHYEWNWIKRYDDYLAEIDGDDSKFDFEWNPVDDAFNLFQPLVDSPNFVGDSAGNDFEIEMADYSSFNNLGFLFMPEIITGPLCSLVKHAEPYLYEKFKNLWAFTFCPHYVFPDSEEYFWSKFNVQKLRSACVNGRFTR